MSERLRAVFLPVPATFENGVQPLAEAFASSPPWASMPRAVTVVKDGPSPAWGVLGWLDDAQAARVEAAAWQVPQTLARLRYVDYSQAEADATVLAARLLERFGEQAREFAYRPVPRGGHIVFGMLAYALQLPKTASSGLTGGPLVLVDDCALSGARIRTALAEHPGPDLVMATLYSQPQLRDAVLAAEPRVVDFVSARDLDDHAPGQFGDDYTAWVARWRERTDDYWIGNPDHVAFAWSEPDMTVWNDVTAQAEAGWRVVPPSQCLKNRAAGTPRLQLQPRAQAGAVQVAPDVLFGSVGTQTLAASASHGTVVSLSGVAVDVWEAILYGADEKGIAQEITVRYAVSDDKARADVAALVSELVDKGLLRRG